MFCEEDAVKLRNWLLFVLLVFLWGSNWPLMKIGLGFATPLSFVLHRFLISAVVLLPLFIVLRKSIPRDANTLLMMTGLCIVFVSAMIAQSIGLVEGSSGIGALLIYTQPLFVFCLAVPLLKEKVTVVKVIGVLLGFAGVVTLFLGRINLFSLHAAVTMLSSAVFWAVATVYYKKYLSHVDPLITNEMQLLVGSIPLIIWSFTTNSFTHSTDATYLWILLCSSTGALAFGNVIWLFLLKHEEATTLSASSLLVPALAMFFGWQLLGESITTESVLGSILTLSGVGLVNLRRRNNHRSIGQISVRMFK